MPEVGYAQQSYRRHNGSETRLNWRLRPGTDQFHDTLNLLRAGSVAWRRPGRNGKPSVRRIVYVSTMTPTE